MMFASYLAQASGDLFKWAYSQGWQHRVWAALTGRSRRLLDLATVQTTCTVVGRHHAGWQTVPIDQIRGSLGRYTDFDLDFYPLQTHTRDRWLRIARAQQQGVSLPLVDLIQVGDVYFVRDGHHRISVAQALEQPDIDAQVTVWRIASPSPEEKPAPVMEQSPAYLRKPKYS